MTGPHTWRCTIAALAASTLLAACGGGGGSQATPPAASPPASPPAAGQAGAPSLTGNIPADGLAWINYRRSQIGVPALSRNALVDKAAQAHSDYQRINNVVAHEETAGKTGFTGKDTYDRVLATGYAFNGGYTGEVISATSSNSGFYMAEELITAIYHRFVMFEPVFRDVGTGAATNTSGYTYFTANFTANTTNVSGIGRGAMVTWPANNQALVPTSFLSDNESPDPVDNVNEVGYPISVHADIRSTIVVDSFTVRARGGSDLNVKLLKPGGDVHTARSVAAIIPLAVLRSGTTYDVSFAGTVDGVAANRTWSFTTR